jgi:hypothetical protein
MTTRDAASSAMASPRPRIFDRWPMLIGIGTVVLLAVDGAEGTDQAEPLAAAALIYLAVAVLGKPSTAWPLFAGALVVIFVTQAAFGGDVDPAWVLLGSSVPLLVYGLLSSAARSYQGFPPQAIAMVGFGVATAVALGLNDDVGAYLLAAGLLGHALWDAHLYRTNKWVVRSMTEFCFVLDALLAVVIVSVTV